MFVLFLVFIVAPVIELYVMVQVAGAIGVLPTVGLIVLSSIAGAWLVKIEGLGVLRRMRDTLDAGQLPTDEAVNGLLIVLGGVLMFLPGFITSAIGLLLLLPPVRAGLRPLVLARARRRIERGGAAVTFATFRSDESGPSTTYGRMSGGSVIDAESHLDPGAPRGDGPGRRGQPGELGS
jgi:UPF0716 protein FxsA